MEAWPLLCNLCLSRHNLLVSLSCMWRMWTTDRGQSSNQSSPPFKPSVSVSLLHVSVYWHHNCLSKHTGYDNNNIDAVYFSNRVHCDWLGAVALGWGGSREVVEVAEDVAITLVFFRTPAIHSSWLTVQVICVLWKIQNSKIIHLDSWTQGRFVRR